MPALFISDLHLCPSRPGIVRIFEGFLSGPARHAEALYILGDLFEYWAGDDDLPDPFNKRICNALRELSDSGTAVYFMAGNRDFLIGEMFANAAGLTRLDDPTIIQMQGCQTLLTHGDTLCTDDTSYQNFRATVRSPSWQQAFLGRPLGVRKAEIAAMRRESETQKNSKSMQTMDVNPGAVLQQLTFSNCTRIIHGHTHRPAHHALENEGITGERWVLPDWYERGGYLACNETGCRLRNWPEV